jgi:hypothetical protein
MRFLLSLLAALLLATSLTAPAPYQAHPDNSEWCYNC